MAEIGLFYVLAQTFPFISALLLMAQSVPLSLVSVYIHGPFGWNDFSPENCTAIVELRFCALILFYAESGYGWPCVLRYRYV